MRQQMSDTLQFAVVIQKAQVKSQLARSVTRRQTEVRRTSVDAFR